MQINKIKNIDTQKRKTNVIKGTVKYVGTTVDVGSCKAKPEFRLNGN